MTIKQWMRKRRIDRAARRSKRKFAVLLLPNSLTVVYDKSDPRYALMIAPFGCRLCELVEIDDTGMTFRVIPGCPNYSEPTGLMELSAILDGVK